MDAEAIVATWDERKRRHQFVLPDGRKLYAVRVGESKWSLKDAGYRQLRGSVNTDDVIAHVRRMAEDGSLEEHLANPSGISAQAHESARSHVARILAGDDPKANGS